MLPWHDQQQNASAITDGGERRQAATANGGCRHGCRRAWLSPCSAWPATAALASASCWSRSLRRPNLRRSPQWAMPTSKPTWALRRRPGSDRGVTASGVFHRGQRCRCRLCDATGNRERTAPRTYPLALATAVPCPFPAPEWHPRRPAFPRPMAPRWAPPLATIYPESRMKLDPKRRAEVEAAIAEHLRRHGSREWRRTSDQFPGCPASHLVPVGGARQGRAAVAGAHCQGRRWLAAHHVAAVLHEVDDRQARPHRNLPQAPRTRL